MTQGSPELEKLTIKSQKTVAISILTGAVAEGACWAISSLMKGIVKKALIKSADEVNDLFITAGKNAPYKSGTDVIEFTTTESEKFVRVFSDQTTPEGGWIMKQSEIEGLLPYEIKDKFALPELPTKIVDVVVPSGTKMRVGISGPIEGWGNGGGTQFELLEIIDKSNFSNIRTL